MIYTFNKESPYDNETSDIVYHALLAGIKGDSKTYRAASRPDSAEWMAAVKKELDAFTSFEVLEIVDRPTADKNVIKPNMIGSRWIFKTKRDELDQELKKDGIVIRGFKDKNTYDLRETYAPVSRLPLLRSMLALANKKDLEIYQLDCTSAFLQNKIKVVVYMDISEGMPVTADDRLNQVCKLKKSLSGLKTSPKQWYGTL